MLTRRDPFREQSPCFYPKLITSTRKRHPPTGAEADTFHWQLKEQRQISSLSVVPTRGEITHYANEFGCHGNIEIVSLDKEASEPRVDVLGCDLEAVETSACSAAPAGGAETQAQSGPDYPRGGLSGDQIGVPGCDSRAE